MRKLHFAIFVCVVLILLALIWATPMGTKPGSAASAASSQQSPSKGKIRTGADAATLAVRDAGNQLIRIATRNEEDREAARELGTVVEDYGTFVIVAVSRAMVHGKTFEQADKIETGIHLPGFSFEPLTESAERAFAGINGMVKPTGDGGDYYIVQFAAPARDEWLAELRAAGAEVLQYVPHQAFFVYSSREAMATIENHPRVRWTGVFHPLYKLSPQMRQLALTQSATGSNIGQFDIVVFKQASLESAATTVSDFGARIKHRIVLPGNYFNVIRVEMDAGLILPVMQIPGVITIDPYIQPTKEDERAAHIVAGNFTNNTTISGPGYDSLTQFGVDGTNVTVAVVDDGVGIPGDGGFYITSGNAVNAPLRGAAAGALGHGHLNATIIAGDLPFSSLLDPTGHNYGLGVARKSHIINVPLLRGTYNGSEADTCNDTVTTSGPNGVTGFISNNSWGAGLNGNSYDSLAAQYDGFVRDSSFASTIDPLVIVFSAGNQGTSGLTRPKVAKNVITTANSENLRPELTSSANNLDDLASSSSRGPASDGRIKPDITAPGTGVSGGRSGTDTLFGNIDAHHRWSTGTSHAAPQIAGAAALFTQFWKNGNGDSNPSPALVKAAILNGGQEMSGANVSASIPNGAEGWGRLNLKNVLNTGVGIKYVNQTAGLTTNGQEFVYNGTIATDMRHFRATLVWTDPPGVSNPALVNNLDLEVTVGATTYKGNVFSGGLSASGGSADTINNVENVWLATGVTAGTPVTVRVRATALNGDGILGDADTTDQHFALVVFNFNEGPVCEFTLNPTSANYTAAGGSDSVSVMTDVACNWSASSNNSWIQIGGTPVGPGNGSVNYSVSANSGPARNGSMTIAGLSFPVTQASGCTAITVSPGTLPNGDVGIPYSQNLMVEGGTPGYTLSVSGNLPTGISLVGTALTGTPTTAGTFAFTIQATDSLGCTGSQSYSVTINNHLQFYPLPRPVRLLDTRAGEPGCDAPGAPVNGGSERTQLARRTCDGVTIPPNAIAITGNVTPVPNSTGFLTLFPSNATRPLVANSNFVAGEIVNNVFTVGLGTDGAFKIFASTTTHVVVDVTGYYAPPSASGLYFHPLPTPIRLLETRANEPGCDTPGAALGGGSTRTQQGRVTCNGVTIPNSALALVGNATVVNPTGTGFLTLFPSNATQPVVSNGNYVGGDIVNTPFTVGLGADGAFKIFTTQTTHVVVDVLGYFSPDATDANGAGLQFYSLATPVRLLDSRVNEPACNTPGAAFAGGTEYSQQARGTCGGQTIPTTALAVVGNVTTVNPVGGFLTLWPSNVARPLIATSNFATGQIANRHFTVGLAPDGTFKLYSLGTTHLVIDLSGYFAP